MKCANCGNTDSKTLWNEGDTIFCSKCSHRTRTDDNEDDVVLCPVCRHMRDRKALYCQWCNNTWGSDQSFSQEAYDDANELEESIDSTNIRYFKLKGRKG